MLSPSKNWSFTEIREWVQKVHLCKNSVESLLGCIANADLDTSSELRYNFCVIVCNISTILLPVPLFRNTWLRIQVVVLFTEHVLIKLPESDLTILKMPQRFYGVSTVTLQDTVFSQLYARFNGMQLTLNME